MGEPLSDVPRGHVPRGPLSSQGGTRLKIHRRKLTDTLKQTLQADYSHTLTLSKFDLNVVTPCPRDQTLYGRTDSGPVP